MIHVLIERNIANGMATTYEAAAKSTLHLAYKAKGFVNGEIFTDMHNPNRRFVLSRWRSVSDWNIWQNSMDREHIMNALNPTLDEPEKFTVLES